MIKVILSPKSEQGHYRLQHLTPTGYVSNEIEVTDKQLPELVEEIAEASSGEEKDVMLDTLRKCYQLFEIKAISMEEKE